MEAFESIEDVKNFWNKQSCGEALYLHDENKASYELQRAKRYQLEPEIPIFAQFDQFAHKNVLEIGVGLGADHQMFAENKANLFGIDLTSRAIEHVKKRFSLFGLYSQLAVCNAESLHFENNSFDLIYSWGVIHHSPNTQQIVNEIYRTLKPGGVAKVMIYHKYSLVGYMLWLRFALLSLKPLTTLKKIYSEYLESPGTKAYSKREAEILFSEFSAVKIKTVLTHADLLNSDVGQRHRGLLLSMIKKCWPRWFFKLCFKNCGLFMMIEARK